MLYRLWQTATELMIMILPELVVSVVPKIFSQSCLLVASGAKCNAAVTKKLINCFLSFSKIFVWYTCTCFLNENPFLKGLFQLCQGSVLLFLMSTREHDCLHDYSSKLLRMTFYAFLLSILAALIVLVGSCAQLTFGIVIGHKAGEGPLGMQGSGPYSSKPECEIAPRKLLKASVNSGIQKIHVKLD